MYANRLPCILCSVTGCIASTVEVWNGCIHVVDEVSARSYYLVHTGGLQKDEQIVCEVRFCVYLHNIASDLPRWIFLDAFLTWLIFKVWVKGQPRTRLTLCWLQWWQLSVLWPYTMLTCSACTTCSCTWDREAPPQVSPTRTMILNILVFLMIGLTLLSR